MGYYLSVQIVIYVFNMNAVVLYTMARLETVGGGHTRKLSTITDVILALTEKIKIDKYAQ